MRPPLTPPVGGGWLLFSFTMQRYEKFSKYKSLKGIISRQKAQKIFIFYYLCSVKEKLMEVRSRKSIRHNEIRGTGH